MQIDLERKHFDLFASKSEGSVPPVQKVERPSEHRDSRYPLNYAFVHVSLSGSGTWLRS